MSTPDYYLPIMPYMVLKDADDFIIFIKKVFDAEEKLIVRNPDESIMHAEFTLNGGTILFGDAGEKYPPFPAPLYLATPKVDELYKRGIENGATGIWNLRTRNMAERRDLSTSGEINGG